MSRCEARGCAAPSAVKTVHGVALCEAHFRALGAGRARRRVLDARRREQRGRLVRALAALTARPHESYWRWYVARGHGTFNENGAHVPYRGDGVQSWPWDVAHGGEAWEVLAARGLVPPEWVDDPARRFAVRGPFSGRVMASHAATAPLPVAAPTGLVTATGSPTFTVSGGTPETRVLGSQPATPEAALAVAVALPRLVTAEAIVRQYCPGATLTWEVAPLERVDEAARAWLDQLAWGPELTDLGVAIAAVRPEERAVDLLCLAADVDLATFAGRGRRAKGLAA